MCARQSLLGSLAAAVVLLGGCESQGPTLPSDPTPPLSFTLTPHNATIEEGQTLQLDVTVTDATGRSFPATGILWSSSNRSVARVVGPGKVQGLAAGTAMIAATWEGVSDQAEVQVRAQKACPPLVRAAVPCPGA